MITGHKDTDLRVLLELDDREFLIFCGKDSQFKNKYINKLCNDEALWRDRLFKYYGQFYPEVGQTWKNLYLSLVYRLDKYKYAKDNNSFTNASRKGHLDVMKYLMSFPGINLSDNNWAIILASQEGHLDVVKYLMSLPNADPSTDNNSPIIWASGKGHLDVVKYLMSLPKKYKIDPSAGDNQAIILASDNGHLDVVKYLISLPKEYKINPSAQDNEAIKRAIEYERLNVVKYLMSLPKKYGVHYQFR